MIISNRPFAFEQLTNIFLKRKADAVNIFFYFFSRIIDGIQCSVNKTQEFGCSDEFYDFLLHSSYVRLPVECLEPNSSKFRWLDMYTEIPTKLPESQNRTDIEEENTTIDDTVSSSTCNYMSHISIIALNVIFTCYKQFKFTIAT